MLDRVVVGSDETRFFLSYGWDGMEVHPWMGSGWYVPWLLDELDYGQLIILKENRNGRNLMGIFSLNRLK